MTQTSKEYAEALFELALGDGNTAEMAAALDLVEEELDRNPGYLALLSSPAISREDRSRSLEEVFGARVPNTLLALLRMMTVRGHAGGIHAMADAYRALDREHRGESIARVTSAVELTEAEKAALQESLSKRFGRAMILRCAVDPALLGGLRVEAEGRVIDGSLRGRLQQIKEVMDS